MPLVNGGKIADDSFVKLAVDTPLPEGGDILVPAERFVGEADALLKRTGKVGVIWPNNRDIAELVPYLGKIAVVALVFPTFRDGRAYSQARLLRARYRFAGEVRATGEVLVDMLPLLHRTGFDAALLRADQSTAIARRVFAAFADGHYQGDVHETRPRFARPAA